MHSEVEIQPVEVYEVVGSDGWTKRKNVSYIPSGALDKAAFFVNYDSRSSLTVHAGPGEGAPVIGSVKMHCIHGPEITFNQEDTRMPPIHQQMHKHHLLSSSQTCLLPAINGNASQVYTWKKTTDHGAKRLVGGNSVLVDETGREYVAYIRKTNSKLTGTEGFLKILDPTLGAEAIRQIIISCAALQECLRQVREANNAHMGLPANV